MNTVRNSIRVRARRTPAAAIVASMLLAACHPSPPPAQFVRPVRAVVAQTGAASTTLDLPGEVRPRIESRLGFRIGGKIVQRKVDQGQTVRKGQLLAMLDPQDLRLAQASAKAQLESAASSKAFADADYRRYEDLYRQNFISRAELDRRKTTLDAAVATYEQAQANYRNQRNQAGYASLLADADGVVTSVDAEPGQVVSAGQTVVRVARTEDTEVWVAVPEDRVDGIRGFKTATVTLWALPNAHLSAGVRELAAAADPATRSYALKLTIDHPPPAVRIGMTAVASFASAAPAGLIRLPLTALTERNGQSSVWVVDPTAMTVSLAHVEIAGPSGNDVLVSGGISPGQRIVTAGVNLLQPGQKVKLLDAVADAARTASSAPPAKPDAGARP